MSTAKQFDLLETIVCDGAYGCRKISLLYAKIENISLSSIADIIAFPTNIHVENACFMSIQEAYLNFTINNSSVGSLQSQIYICCVLG